MLGIKREIRWNNHVSCLVRHSVCVTLRVYFCQYWDNLQSHTRVITVGTFLFDTCGAWWKKTPWNSYWTSYMKHHVLKGLIFRMQMWSLTSSNLDSRKVDTIQPSETVTTTVIRLCFPNMRWTLHGSRGSSQQTSSEATRNQETPKQLYQLTRIMCRKGGL